MKLHTFATACALLLGPAAAIAHGTPPAPAHGGQMQEAAEHWVELVTKGDQLTVYVSEPDNKPLPAKEWSGKATVLVGGKTEVVALTPGEGNSATGKLAAPAAGKMTAVIQLTLDGKPAQARFATSQ